MGQITDRDFVITFNQAIERFCRVMPNGSHEPMEFTVSMKMGDVAKMVGRTNPEMRIGIMSDAVGPWCRATFGEVIWMKQGFWNN